MDSIRGFNQRREYGSERGLFLDLRPRCKTRGNSDAEFATPVFKMQGLPHPRPEVSKELVKNRKRELHIQSSCFKIQTQSLSHSRLKNL